MSISTFDLRWFCAGDGAMHMLAKIFEQNQRASAARSLLPEEKAVCDQFMPRISHSLWCRTSVTHSIFVPSGAHACFSQEAASVR